MINIFTPYIEKNGAKSRCCCDIAVDGEKKNVWFEVDSEYEKYLCTERSDAYVIGFLSFAMRGGHDIICEAPVTDELLYNISTFLIPSLCKYGKNLHAIRIRCSIAPPLAEGDAVGTGCSCGVDSFYSIAFHMNSSFPRNDLTHLCINNVGAFNECYDDYGREKAMNERYTETRKVATKAGLPLIETNSNFWDEFYQNHLRTHTYSSCFAVYMLQKLWRVYYYASSGYDFSLFSLKDNDLYSSDHYELLSLQCFSTSMLRIYSDGGEKDRFEKTEGIVSLPLAQQHLHVCIRKPYNCGQCSKCRRTLLTLDALNALDDFSAVFDVEEYRKKLDANYLWLYSKHKEHDDMVEPIYEKLLKKQSFSSRSNHIKRMYVMQQGIKKLRGIAKLPRRIMNKLTSK